MKKTWVFLVCFVFSAFALFGQNASDFKTKVKDGKVTITGYTGTVKDVRIPDKINGLPVTAIGGYSAEDGDLYDAFKREGLTSVTIPNSVTSIGMDAFNRNQLTSVTIPNSVTSIGMDAFSNNKLTSVTIPNSITSIYLGTFSNNQLTSVTIPNSVTFIETRTFRNNQLTSVTIPNSVATIEWEAFDSNVKIIQAGQ
ncbi:MAG: leucine-rich repeat domain-containing protein [Treponema sp.]|jgi:virulence-associated protein VagC|nr:leucine-rich repeat domain-containing protein [Treponema sp.]